MRSVGRSSSSYVCAKRQPLRAVPVPVPGLLPYPQYDPFAAMAYVEDEDQEEDEELEDDDDEVDDDDMAEAFETGGAAMGLDGRRRRRRGEDEDDDEDDELPDDGLEAVDELGMGMSVEEKYGLDVVPRKKVDSDQAIINQVGAEGVRVEREQPWKASGQHGTAGACTRRGITATRGACAGHGVEAQAGGWGGGKGAG